jgi:hypothetical protein
MSSKYKGLHNDEIAKFSLKIWKRQKALVVQNARAKET